MKKYSIAIIIFIVLIVLCVLLLFFDNNQNNPGDNTGSDDNTVEVNSIALDTISLVLIEGDSATIRETILPVNATNKTVTWESSDSSIATVDNGNVTGLTAGNAIITAKSNNGKTATCEVIVKKPIIEVSEVILDKESLSIKVGAKETLTATINPSDATDKSIEWISGDNSIATVDNGVITGVKAGTVAIIAKANNNKYATCTVVVKPINYNFKCSGKVDTDGTSAKVTGDNLDVVKKYRWDLNGKEVDGKNAYKNATRGYTNIKVTLTLDDGRTKTVKCSITDKLPYHFKPNNGTPLYSSGYCGKISDAENDKLNSQLNSIINKVGRGTRAGVVEAGRFLMGNIPYVIAYQGTGGNNIYTAGLHFGTKTNSWGCRKNGYINGMDCTGFMNWPFNTNGIRRAYSNSPTPVRGNLDKIRVGDVLLSYDRDKKNIVGIPFGHDELIIGIDDDYIYTLSNGLNKISKKNPPNPSTNCRNGDCTDPEHQDAYYRNVIYANGDGKLTNMWIKW
jgi:uncharacterized protein YjdB